MQVTTAEQRRQALAVIHAAQNGRGHPELNFLALALQGKKVDFGKVIKMIDDMVATLGVEQQDNNDKKEYCETQFDLADDKKKGLERSVANLEKTLEKEKQAIEALADEIAALEAGLKALDKSVAEATEQRKEENADYTELMANDGAAKELLGFAKNRLNKFYNPKLYKAPPKTAPALAEVSAHAAPPPPPETAAAFSKKSEESNGVIAMIDTMIGDLTKEMTEAKTEEANAELEAEKEASTEEKAATTKTLMATLEHIQALHAECDWLLQYYEVRKEARAGEVESLKTAKSVLSGADFSLLETSSQHRSLRGQM